MTISHYSMLYIISVLIIYIQYTHQSKTNIYWCEIITFYKSHQLLQITQKMPKTYLNNSYFKRLRKFCYYNPSITCYLLYFDQSVYFNLCRARIWSNMALCLCKWINNTNVQSLEWITAWNSVTASTCQLMHQRMTFIGITLLICSDKWKRFNTINLIFIITWWYNLTTLI